ncbi:MAG: WD40/YVTN/BNR-like repeat-containing protein, partial [Myxococcales bacterium]
MFLLLASAASAQELEPDDPGGRVRARALIEAPRSPEEQIHILQEAAAEAAKWKISGFRSFAAVSGAAWVNVGPGNGAQVSPLPQSAADTGRVRKIVPHPTDPNILYVATAGGGVWKTFDAQSAVTLTGGPHWTSITSGIGSQSVGAFALDPNSPDTLFLGLGDPFDVQTPGFYTSLDGGINWSGPVSLGSATSVRDIVVDPSGTGAVLVATNAGLFRQIEGGPWQQKDLGGATDCWSIAWVGPSRWLVTCYGHLFLSTDNG